MTRTALHVVDLASFSVQSFPLQTTNRVVAAVNFERNLFVTLYQAELTYYTI